MSSVNCFVQCYYMGNLHFWRRWYINYSHYRYSSSFSFYLFLYHTWCCLHNSLLVHISYYVYCTYCTNRTDLILMYECYHWLTGSLHTWLITRRNKLINIQYLVLSSTDQSIYMLVKTAHFGPLFFFFVIQQATFMSLLTRKLFVYWLESLSFMETVNVDCAIMFSQVLPSVK